MPDEHRTVADVGQIVRGARGRTGRTQSEIAASAGISASSWGAVERGVRRPGKDLSRKIEQALGWPSGRLDDLYAGKPAVQTSPRRTSARRRAASPASPCPAHRRPRAPWFRRRRRQRTTFDLSMVSTWQLLRELYRRIDQFPGF